MATHTPGPWRVITEDGSLGSVEDSAGDPVAQAQIRGTTKDFRHDERRANAALIAAAPDLLFALRGIVVDLPARRDWLDPAIESAAKAAIAKAEGRG